MQCGRALYSCEMPKTRIANESDLSEGAALKFDYMLGEKKLEGFVARYKGKVVCYRNVCRHIPISLDYGDNRFFTRDGAHFVCQTHGATYDPHSGVCVQGPCKGEKLFSLPIQIADGVIWLDL